MADQLTRAHASHCGGIVGECLLQTATLPFTTYGLLEKGSGAHQINSPSCPGESRIRPAPMPVKPVPSGQGPLGRGLPITLSALVTTCQGRKLVGPTKQQIAAHRVVGTAERAMRRRNARLTAWRFRLGGRRLAAFPGNSTGQGPRILAQLLEPIATTRFRYISPSDPLCRRLCRGFHDFRVRFRRPRPEDSAPFAPPSSTKGRVRLEIWGIARPEPRKSQETGPIAAPDASSRTWQGPRLEPKRPFQQRWWKKRDGHGPDESQTSSRRGGE